LSRDKIFAPLELKTVNWRGWRINSRLCSYSRNVALIVRDVSCLSDQCRSMLARIHLTDVDANILTEKEVWRLG